MRITKSKKEISKHFNELNNDLIINNNLSINSSLYSYKNAIFNNNVTIGNSLSVANDTIIQNDSTIFSSMNISDFTIIQGNSTINTSLYVSSQTTINGDVTIKSNLTINNSTNIQGNLTVLSDLGISGNTIIQGNIVLGDPNLSSKLNLLGQVVNYLPRNLADGTEFRSVFQQALESKGASKVAAQGASQAAKSLGQFETKNLLKMTIDTGIDQRTVVSGIAAYYEPENIIGQQVTILVNLAPRDIKGITSEGMILMAENVDGSLAFIAPTKAISNGGSVK